MALTTAQLTTELAKIVDPSMAKAAVDSYVEMQQRFLAGDWQPTELNGGRLCEAIARCCYQLDSGIVAQQLPGHLSDKMEDVKAQHSHHLSQPDRNHLCQVIRLVYKFRSARGSVHISPVYTA